MTEYGKALQANESPIPGLLVVELPVHGDSRGWFKENWQREKMAMAGLPDFRPVQNNISFNDAVGTTRGFHAEPWDKFVSVATGRIFGAWVDLRSGPNYGITFSAHLDPSRAVFVPRGVGNAFQTLERNTAYTYLVNDHYSADAEYISVNLADETLGIAWPIPLHRAVVSAKDRKHPRIAEVPRFPYRKTIVVGADGQLGHALREAFGTQAGVDFASRSDVDISSIAEYAEYWREYDTVINAAAYTAVDSAETPNGRAKAWATNADGVAALARVANRYGTTLLHVSSDYVFDGTASRPYREDDAVTPLSVYGQTKAAADRIVSTVPNHYIVRTSWVIGRGHNFVRTMRDLAANGANPNVVNDQHGRLTFTSELARAIRHLLEAQVPYGTYNVTGSGPITSWADIAKRVFALTGHDPERVTGVSTEAYSLSRSGPSAPRPRNSVLDLTKIASTGFAPKPVDECLPAHLQATTDGA